MKFFLRPRAERLKPSRLFAITFAAATLFGAFAGCDAENAIVGGTCASGFTACGGDCVDVETNAAHCGGCDLACSGTCTMGVCSSTDGSTDGSSGDGSSDGAGDDGSIGDGSIGDGGTGDGGIGDGGSNGDACPPPPYDTPAACGACGIVCTSPNSACLLDGTDALVCSLPCTPPLVACHGRCIDTSSDPENCGACGKICPSNLCLNGQCQGSTPGDIVVIGHDYESAASGSSQAKVLTNAVFIPRSDPLRILSYEQYAKTPVVARVKSIINGAALGRTVTYTVVNDPSPLTSATLSKDYDVVLLHDQRNAAASTLATIGAGWVSSFATFTKAGGVVVALDGAVGQAAMPSLVTSSGLLNLAGHTSIAPGTPVTIVAPTDRVGTLVLSPYGTFANSASFQSNEAESVNLVVVARQLVNNTPTNPVVVHKIVP